MEFELGKLVKAVIGGLAVAVVIYLLTGGVSPIVEVMFAAAVMYYIARR
jgi:hypothetical protein